MEQMLSAQISLKHLPLGSTQLVVSHVFAKAACEVQLAIDSKGLKSNSNLTCWPPDYS